MKKELDKEVKQKLSTTAVGAVGGLGAAIGVQNIDGSSGETDRTEGSEQFPGNDPAVNQVSGTVDDEPDKNPAAQTSTVEQQVDEADDEVIDGIAYDLNDDGIIDAVALDLNHDGIAEYAGIDTNGDHVADMHLIDIDSDYSYDLAIQEQVSATEDGDTGTGEDQENSSNHTYSDDNIAYDMDNDADVSEWA